MSTSSARRPPWCEAHPARPAPPRTRQFHPCEPQHPRIRFHQFGRPSPPAVLSRPPVCSHASTPHACLPVIAPERRRQPSGEEELQLCPLSPKGISSGIRTKQVTG